MVDKTRDELFIKQVVGRDFESVKHLRFRIGIDGIVGWVAKTGEPYYSSGRFEGSPLSIPDPPR